MSQEAPFIPQGNTVVIDSTDVASAAKRVQTGASGKSSPQIMVTNPSLSIHAWLANGDASVVAAIPDSTTPANGLRILPNSTQILSYNPNSFFSAICDTGGEVSLELTPGEGF